MSWPCYAIDMADSEKIMTIATCSIRGPWSAPVYYVFREREFYFFSSPESRHIMDTIIHAKQLENNFPVNNTAEDHSSSHNTADYNANTADHNAQNHNIRNHNAENYNSSDHNALSCKISKNYFLFNRNKADMVNVKSPSKTSVVVSADEIKDSNINSRMAGVSIFSDSQSFDNIKGLQMSGRIEQVIKKTQALAAAGDYIQKFKIKIKDIKKREILQFIAQNFHASFYKFVPYSVYYMDNSIKFGYREKFTP